MIYVSKLDEFLFCFDRIPLSAVKYVGVVSTAKTCTQIIMYVQCNVARFPKHYIDYLDKEW